MLLTREQALVWAALNLPFVLCHPAAPLVSEPLLRSLAINAVLFVAPGFPLASLLLKKRAPSPPVFLWVIAASAAVGLAILLAARLAGAPPEAGLFWNAAWLATNAAMLASVAAKAPSWRPLLPGRESVLIGLLLFAGAYAAYFQGATKFVPPMEDHDYETQGTGYGLLSSLRPALPTDRGTSLYFAHPPLLHFYVAGSFLYWDRLDHLAPYAATTDVAALYERFRRDPAPLPTRTPNLFLAALTVALLGTWARRLSGRTWLGLLVGAAYASSPEVFVRSSYGGYFAAGQLATAMLLLAASARESGGGRGAARGCLLAGAFAALVDHKLVFLPLALAAWELRRSRALHPAAAGFALGAAAFWLYGLSIDAGAFWLDHVRTHLLDRVTHHNPLGYGGYPGPAGLWLEFSRHTGHLLLPLGAAALAAGWTARSASAREDARLWTAWAVLAALAFTIVDWRQTKHLAPLLLPLFLAPALWAGLDRRGLYACASGMLALAAWNLGAVWALCRDFAGFAISPAW